jgi:hypothetical protein
MFENPTWMEVTAVLFAIFFFGALLTYLVVCVLNRWFTLNYLRRVNEQNDKWRKELVIQAKKPFISYRYVKNLKIKQRREYFSWKRAKRLD